MRNIETLIRLAIISACIYVSIVSVIEFYQTMSEFRNMPPYPLTPRDPSPAHYRKDLWISFGIHLAASAVAICAAGRFAIFMWFLTLLPLHAIPLLILFVLSMSLFGIFGSSIYIAANWGVMSTAIGALVGSAAAGCGLAYIVTIVELERWDL